jgi:hypothetical protein
MDRPKAQVQRPRRLRPVPTGSRERRPDRLALEVLPAERLGESEAVGPGAGRRAREREVVGSDIGAGGGDRRVLDDVLELADVPRPPVRAEAGERLGGEREAPAVARGGLAKEGRREPLDVVAARAKGGRAIRTTERR